MLKNENKMLEIENPGQKQVIVAKIQTNMFFSSSKFSRVTFRTKFTQKFAGKLVCGARHTCLWWWN